MYPRSQQFIPVYAEPIHHQHHHTPINPKQQSVSPQPFISPLATLQSQAEFPQLDFGLAVPTFQQGDDPIECINKEMTFLSAVASRGNYAAGQAKVVKCYNCLEEGHMAKQCTQPKKPRSSAWFKEKLMLVEAQEAGQILDEEQLAFIADTGIAKVQVAQQTIPYNSAFQTEDLDANDSNCDDLSSAKAVLMANLSSCDPNVLFEVPYSDSYPNDMINQDVQEIPYSEQTHIDDYPDNEINTLKYELRKLKGKNVVDIAISKPSATIALGMFKLDIEPISHRLKNNRDAHEVYLEKTIENTDTLRRLVECARKQNPSEPLLESSCMFTKHVQKLLVYVSKTFPCLTKPCEKLVVVIPMNKDKKVRFAEPITSSCNIPKQTDSLKTKDSNKPLLTSTEVKPTTSASGLKPSGNTKNNRIT
ncbi:integrase, catalytic region, zinc finger, CCHC-type containing protein [Tanacetum coccineum]